MKLLGIISGSITALCILFMIISCNADTDESAFLNQQLAGIDFSDTSGISAEPVIIYLNTQENFSDNRFLNTVNWELRQPKDLSSSRVTTTANSEASHVQFTYLCGEEKSSSRAVPIEGVVTDSVVMKCDEVLNATLVAVSNDTLVVYEYEINIAFLNSLGN